MQLKKRETPFADTTQNCFQDVVVPQTQYSVMFEAAEMAKVQGSPHRCDRGEVLSAANHLINKTNLVLNCKKMLLSWYWCLSIYPI